MRVQPEPSQISRAALTTCLASVVVYSAYLVAAWQLRHGFGIVSQAGVTVNANPGYGLQIIGTATGSWGCSRTCSVRSARSPLNLARCQHHRHSESR